MYQVVSKILFNREVSATYYRIGLDCPEIASKAAPGQFIMAKVSNQLDPFLRRPFAIHRIRKTGAETKGTGGDSVVEILYNVVGKGTKIMSEMKVGDKIDLLGPVGNGFRIGSTMGAAILVAGGIGVAPLLSLAEGIRLQRSGVKPLLLFLGGKAGDDVLCVEDFERLGVEVRVATEDGSLGHRGVVTDLLLNYLDSREYGSILPSHLFACGPETMLKEVAKIAREKKIPCQVSLETRMACGLGACLGCVVKTRSRVQPSKREGDRETGGQELRIDYKRVCKEGPVFDSNEVLWE
ncbi:MAG: dihydroorotate dehydrogenase electron transfer subunit [Pseudomonadota bacterium]